MELLHGLVLCRVGAGWHIGLQIDHLRRRLERELLVSVWVVLLHLVVRRLLGLVEGEDVGDLVFADVLHLDAIGDHVVLVAAQWRFIKVQVVADAVIASDVLLLGLLLAVLVTLALDLRRGDWEADFSGRL